MSTTYKPSQSFHDAASFVTGPRVSNVPTATKLELYGLYKVLTVSSVVTTSRPSIFSLEARAKWDAWKVEADKWRGREDQAEQRYLEIAQSFGWKSDSTELQDQLVVEQREPTAEELLASDDVPQKASGSGSGMGNSVSAVLKTTETTQDDSGTIHGYAIEDDLEGLVKYLDEHPNCDLNAPDQYGFTALHLACDRGNVRVVEILLKRGADVNVKDADGFTALELAQEAGCSEIVQVLGGPVAGTS